MSTTSKQLLVQILWSFAILYLLAIILILPNSSSLLTRRWGRFLAPVASQFGLNNAWQFFSPAPAPTMYLSYSIDYGGAVASESDYESENLTFPEDGGNGHFSPNYNRKIYAMRFMVINPERIETFFVPWVCRQHPGAKAVTVQHVVEPVPIIETMGIGASYKEFYEKMRFPSLQVACPGVG